MVHHNNCPLCKGTDIQLFQSCTDYLASREEFHLYKCLSCGFVFTRDYPDEHEAGGYYESDDYISHTDSARSLFEKAYRRVRKLMLGRKKNLVTRACKMKKGTILDIGSGTGHFLETMKKAGWITRGVEINQKARDYAISNFHLDVIPPEGISSLPGNSFDTISMWHVLEHLHNPRGYFADIKRLLKPGGKVIVALPNCISKDASHYRNYWAAYDVPRHLWHFSPVTFSLFAGMAGFKITGMASLPFDVFYISILSERNKGTFMPALTGLVKGSVFSILSAFSLKSNSSLVYILEIIRD